MGLLPFAVCLIVKKKSLRVIYNSYNLEISSIRMLMPSTAVF